MKREIIFAIALFIVLISFSQAVEATCKLNTTLINQDPYPAQVGDKVELVFQLSGTDNSDCEGANFEVVPEFPFSLIEGQERRRSIPGSTWTKDNKKEWMIPYELKIDEDATGDKREIEVRYSKGDSSSSVYTSKKFDVKIEDYISDFEVEVYDYNPETKEITFEILNIGENDVEALTAQIGNIEDFNLYGSSRNIIGPLYSNEETTFTIKAEPETETIDLKITYTDQIDERRTINKEVDFNPEYFQEEESEGYSTSFYILIALIALIVLNFIRKRYIKKKGK